MPVISVGDKVFAKHKNCRYYRVTVTKICNQTFYSVDFDDGSFSDDLYPEDIEGHEEGDNPPEEGDEVQVKWTDGELYGATFRAASSHVMYTVEFEDTTEKVFKREELWAMDEEIPKHIKSKLSIATERKYSLFYTEEIKKEVQGHGKRPKNKISYSKLNG